MASSLALAIEHPADEKESPKVKVLRFMDEIFLVFFTFEMLIKWSVRPQPRALARAARSPNLKPRIIRRPLCRCGKSTFTRAACQLRLGGKGA